MSRSVINALELVNASLVDALAEFDLDEGVPLNTCGLVADVLYLIYGKDAALSFTKRINATDGRFYFKIGDYKKFCTEFGIPIIEEGE